MKGYGAQVWAVIASLDVDLNKVALEEDMLESEVVEACINYLNTPPPRKKYAKRTPQPLYGELQLYKYYPKDDGVQVILLVDKRKSKHFWGEGFKR